MATKKFTIKGKAMWAKVFDHNKELKDHVGNPYPHGAEYKINLVLDKDGKATYKASGTAGKGKFDDDGNFIAILKRKEIHKTVPALGGAPEVVNADGSPFEGRIIPNGSEVEVEFTVYTTHMTPGTRLEKVRVLSLAEMPERKDEAPAPKVETKDTSKIQVPF